MDENIKSKLLEKLNQVNLDHIKNFHVVMLPDFFVDHFVSMNSFDYEIERMKDIYNQGGGNIPGCSQFIQQGGNAANTALGLCRLGINVDLICRTNQFGRYLLDFLLGKHGVGLDSVKVDGDLAFTTALEYGKKHVNVMLNDAGSLSDFSFEYLDEKDLERISNCDLVGVVNWSLNNCGTELAENVFDFAKKNNVKTFFDSGDPGHRKNDVSDLLERVIFSKNLDIFSLNENELRRYSGMHDLENKEDFLNALDGLSEKCSTRLDLHTSSFVCSTKTSGEKNIVSTLSLDRLVKVTGAGDAWNAGNIFGDLIGLNDDERLLFANCFAGCYISSKDSIPPTVEDVIRFMNNIF